MTAFGRSQPPLVFLVRTASRKRKREFASHSHAHPPDNLNTCRILPTVRLRLEATEQSNNQGVAHYGYFLLHPSTVGSETPYIILTATYAPCIQMVIAALSLQYTEFEC